MQYLNISGYKFVPIQNTVRMERHFRRLCNTLGIKGSILVGEEGVNMALSGAPESIATFRKNLAEDMRFNDIEFKDSWSDKIPFRHLRVRIKHEIVTMGVDGVDPGKKCGKYITPKELKNWYDEGKDFWVLDTRNDYEVKIGTFDNAVDLDIETFREFPEKVTQLPDELKKKPMVMFCTGGIRCEKASVFCDENGFDEVYQLHDGIIKYFEDCGGEHWHGDCFVFDDRVAVKPDLSATDKLYCLSCFAELSEQDRQSERYSFNRFCPHCFKEEAGQ